MKAAVLGHPIGHSLSPAIHQAAIAALDLDMTYQAFDVDVDGLAPFIGELNEDWVGLSLTMPLKTEVLSLITHIDEVVELTQSANTVYRDASGEWSLTNTDVFGLSEAIRMSEVHSSSSVGILGSGATARSAVVAAVELGASRLVLAARNVRASQEIVRMSSALGVDLEIVNYDSMDLTECGLVISTLPGATAMNYTPSLTVDADAALLDVSYSPWPSALAQWWPNSHVISGKEMLLWQATKQWHLFTGTQAPVASMREAIGLPA